MAGSGGLASLRLALLVTSAATSQRSSISSICSEADAAIAQIEADETSNVVTDFLQTSVQNDPQATSASPATASFLDWFAAGQTATLPGANSGTDSLGHQVLSSNGVSASMPSMPVQSASQWAPGTALPQQPLFPSDLVQAPPQSFAAALASAQALPLPQPQMGIPQIPTDPSLIPHKDADDTLWNHWRAFGAAVASPATAPLPDWLAARQIATSPGANSGTDISGHQTHSPNTISAGMPVQSPNQWAAPGTNLPQQPIFSPTLVQPSPKSLAAGLPSANEPSLPQPQIGIPQTPANPSLIPHKDSYTKPTLPVLKEGMSAPAAAGLAPKAKAVGAAQPIVPSATVKATPAASHAATAVPGHARGAGTIAGDSAAVGTSPSVSKSNAQRPERLSLRMEFHRLNEVLSRLADSISDRKRAKRKLKSKDGHADPMSLVRDIREMREKFIRRYGPEDPLIVAFDHKIAEVGKHSSVTKENEGKYA